MEKILERYDDVGTCGTIVYAKPDCIGLYEDAEYTKLLDPDVVLELFLKGMVVSMTGNLEAGDDGPRQLAKPTRAYFTPKGAGGQLVAIKVMCTNGGGANEVGIGIANE